MNQEMPHLYGEILKRRRKVRGITLNELSDRTNICRSSLVEAEYGKIQLSEQERERIEKFLRRQRII